MLYVTDNYNYYLIVYLIYVYTIYITQILRKFKIGKVEHMGKYQKFELAKKDIPAVLLAN